MLCGQVRMFRKDGNETQSELLLGIVVQALYDFPAIRGPASHVEQAATTTEITLNRVIHPCRSAHIS